MESTSRDQIDKLAKKLRTPKAVQEYLRKMPYNDEETMRSAAAALRAGKSHCFEAAFIAAAILEKHGFPPLIVSIESKDHLDHVVFAFKRANRWGAIGRSRDQGLHGRPAIYRSIRDLVWSYFDPFIDKSGRITGYKLVDLDQTGADWRNSRKPVWRAERYLIDLKHSKLRSSDRRYRELHQAYLKRGPMAARDYWW